MSTFIFPMENPRQRIPCALKWFDIFIRHYICFAIRLKQVCLLLIYQLPMYISNFTFTISNCGAHAVIIAIFGKSLYHTAHYQHKIFTTLFPKYSNQKCLLFNVNAKERQPTSNVCHVIRKFSCICMHLKQFLCNWFFFRAFQLKSSHCDE